MVGMNGVVSLVSLAPSETLKTLSVPASEPSDGGYTVRLLVNGFGGAPCVPVCKLEGDVAE